jgi:hypothetical protein
MNVNQILEIMSRVWNGFFGTRFFWRLLLEKTIWFVWPPRRRIRPRPIVGDEVDGLARYDR